MVPVVILMLLETHCDHIFLPGVIVFLKKSGFKTFYQGQAVSGWFFSFFPQLRWSLIRGPGDHCNLVEHIFLVSLGLRDLKIDAVVRFTGPSVCSSMMTQIVLMAEHNDSVLWVISANLSPSNGWEENAFALKENFERGNFEDTGAHTHLLAITSWNSKIYNRLLGHL